MSEDDPLRPREVAVAAGVAVVLLLVLAWPWVRDAAHAIPDPAAAGNPASGADARLVVWILGWDVHALLTAPLRLFDANIFHPAPGMLAHSEHLLGVVLLSGPVQLLTGNPVLAANVAALATYPLAAVAMYALARTVGLPAPGAAIGAAIFALGFMRVPADIHTLQFANWPLAVLLLAAVHARRRPNLVRRAALGAATLLALLTSYYLAAMAAVLIAVETLLSLRRDGARAAGGLLTATLPAALLLVLLSSPYWRTAAGTGPPVHVDLRDVASGLRLLQPGILAATARQLGGAPALGLALLGLLAPAFSGRRPTERWWRWVALAGAGALLGLGWGVWIGPLFVPLPLLGLIGTPFGLLRAAGRFFVLAQVGTAGLAAEGAQTILALAQRRGGRGIARGVAAALLLVVGLPRGMALTTTPRTVLPTGRAVPAIERWLATVPSEPMLELPAPGPTPGLMLAQSETMYLSLFHWLPLVNGHTGFTPWWFPGLREALVRLPDPRALQTVVDMTGVRWILVRRARVGAAAFDAWTALPDRTAGVERDPHGDPDLLLHVLLAPSRPWERGIARGRPEPGFTLLGTPRAPVPASDIQGAVRSQPTASGTAGDVMSIGATVENRGGADWPALAPPGAPEDMLVTLVAHWLPPGEAPGPQDSTIRLPRDVATDDTVGVAVPLALPREAGTWTLELSLAQRGVGALAGVTPARVRVDVRPASR